MCIRDRSTTTKLQPTSALDLARAEQGPQYQDATQNSGFPLRPRRSMRRLIDCAALSAAMLCSTISLEAQRGGRGADSTGGRGAGLPLAPSKPLKFTTTEGTWLSLDVSPDGRTVVFELLGDIYTIPIDGGKATRLTSGQPFDAQPHYSPDGKSIAFVSDRSQSDNLWIMNADGSSPRALTRENDQRFQSPAFTPDGKYVVASKGNDIFMY